MDDLSRFVPPERDRAFYLDRETRSPTGSRFYECGICGAYHPESWDGDCREDAARFDVEDLDGRYGASGWEEVPMPGAEENE